MISINKTLKTIRGTKDILGQALEAHKKIINVATQLALYYSYQEISLPIFEESSVFYRTLGDSSDIIAKETYTFLDRDKTSITLRPEFTASIIRAFLSNSMTQEIPVKFFTYGPLFRHERPQHARYRQFNQVNFEYIGSNSPLADAEVIAMAMEFVKALGIADMMQIEINTLGHKEDRLLYKDILTEYFAKYKNELSPESLVRLEKNPLRILDSKDENDKKIVATCPTISSVLSTESESRYKKIQDALSSLGIQYTINEKLVRGIDYYTHTVFEFITKELGAQGTALAGGRYDGLVETMGGPSIPAIGFAAGIERLSALYEKSHPSQHKSHAFHLIPIGESAEQYASMLARNLRASGLAIDIEYDKSLKKRMQRANKASAIGVIIFGDSELSNNKLKFKDMRSGIEEEIALESIANYLLTIK